MIGDSPELDIKLDHTPTLIKPQICAATAPKRVKNSDGSHLTGTVILRLPTRRRIHSVSILLSSIATVTFDNGEYEKISPITESFALPLPRSSSSRGLLEAGSHVLPFSFWLPPTLPPAVACRYGKTGYRLKATLKEPGLLARKTETRVDVHPVVDLSVIVGGNLSMKWSADTDLSPLNVLVNIGISSDRLAVGGSLGIAMSVSHPNAGPVGLFAIHDISIVVYQTFTLVSPVRKTIGNLPHTEIMPAERHVVALLNGDPVLGPGSRRSSVARRALAVVRLRGKKPLLQGPLREPAEMVYHATLPGSNTLWPSTWRVTDALTRVSHALAVEMDYSVDGSGVRSKSIARQPVFIFSQDASAPVTSAPPPPYSAQDAFLFDMNVDFYSGNCSRLSDEHQLRPEPHNFGTQVPTLPSSSSFAGQVSPSMCLWR